MKSSEMTANEASSSKISEIIQNEMQNFDVLVVGLGLAGTEAALTLAKHGKKILAIEQKPHKKSPAHQLNGAAELVCSNSFKSLEVASAHGLLKEELRLLGSPLLELARASQIPGGKALVVDREKLSEVATKELKSSPHIKILDSELAEIPSIQKPILIASGPLTSESLMSDIRNKLGDEGLYFYDATSPVVTLESLDQSRFFWGSRREDGDDYLNLALSKDEYQQFRSDILAAEKTEAHLPDEKLKFFEGCLPIEELARRGEDTLAFSCMKPVGFESTLEERPHAIIQFRREKAAAELMSMVGFQTRMKWPEQERVFRKLPGMANAQFARLGAMHRNSFVNAPMHLNHSLSWKKNPQVFMAGQITGSEGYTEALASGHYAALQILGLPMLPEESAIRSLVRYLIDSDPRHFQPMNFNFGLLPSLKSARGKMAAREKRAHLSDRALQSLKLWIEKNLTIGSENSWPNTSSRNPLVLTPTELVKLISNG